MCAYDIVIWLNTCEKVWKAARLSEELIPYDSQTPTNSSSSMTLSPVKEVS